MQHRVPLVQNDACVLEQGAVQHQTFILPTFPAYIALIQSAHTTAVHQVRSAERMKGYLAVWQNKITDGVDWAEQVRRSQTHAADT